VHKKIKMKRKIVKIIITLLILYGIYALIKKFPEETILVLGIGSIIIIGLWLLEVDKETT